MTDRIGIPEWTAMLRRAAALIRENQDVLSRLDSCGGDGDHGTTMARAMNLVEKTLNEAACGSLAALFRDIGWAIMGVDGGATGPLFGSLFLAMADAAESNVEGDTLDTAALASLLEAGLAGIQKHTRARVGDKTMIDALTPATAALVQAATEDFTVRQALQRAADAAHQGAASTVALQARFGRAKNLGEKSKGTEDPGARSVALIFQGFSDGLCKET